MKYLIQHTKELIITIGVFLSILLVILWAVFAIVKGQFSYENIVAIIGVVFEILGWYYNMPTSAENAKHTGAMRLEKEQNAGVFTGENFMDEFEEDTEDGEPLDEDEENAEEFDDGPNDDGGEE